MVKVLNACLVTEFYKQHIGFFAKLAFIGIGIISGSVHLSIAQLAIVNPGLLSVICLTWILYFLMVNQWLSNQMALPENQFLFTIRIIPLSQRLSQFLNLAFQLLIPVMLYSAFIIVIAIQNNTMFPILIIVSVNILLLSSTAIYLEWLIRNPSKCRVQSSKTTIQYFRRPISYPFWNLEWLVREKTVTLLITKTASLLTIIGVIIYYQSGEYDLRLPTLGITFAILLNSGITSEIHFWQQQTWAWLRSMPIPTNRLLKELVSLHILILLPETLITWRYGWNVFEWYEILQLNIYSMALLLGIHSLFYFKNLPFEEMIKLLFWLFIALTFLILFKVPLLFLSIIILSITGVIYKKRSPYSRTPPE